MRKIWNKEAQEYFRRRFQGHGGHWCKKLKEKLDKAIKAHDCMDEILQDWKWWYSKYHWGMGEQLQGGCLTTLGWYHWYDKWYQGGGDIIQKTNI